MSRNDYPDISNLAVLGAMFSIYVGISMICFMLGVCEADRFMSSCNSPMTKIEYIFPAHAVGCWANKPVDNRK